VDLARGGSRPMQPARSHADAGTVQAEVEAGAGRLSKPLRNSSKQTARVGDYRILFVVESGILLVSFIGPRGQIYRNA
jgi:mRNA-degrading endonuclease RelE of RelBE toxin-antitoxin system